MKIGPVVLKLRLAKTRFNNNIAGAAELSFALRGTLKEEMAFVVQLAENASANTLDSSVNQLVTERFGVIVALNNGVSDRDKTGLTAYDSLFDVRAQLWKALLGWEMEDAETLISYSGGRVIGINKAQFWYQFEFQFGTRIDTCDDGVDDGTEDLPDFDKIYAQWVLAPSANLPVGNLPVTIFDPDMTSLVDLTDDPNAGEFGKGFGLVFDYYKG